MTWWDGRPLDADALCTLSASDVRFGSLADIGVRISDVRFTPESGHAQHGH